MTAPLRKAVVLRVPAYLHPETRNLVVAFAEALATKLREAERKHRFLDNWRRHGWRADCLADFQEHISKGDPIDVAAYCAFMWHHGWGTNGDDAPSTRSHHRKSAGQ